MQGRFNIQKLQNFINFLINKEISTKTFIISNILIIFFGIIFLGWLYYILYWEFKSNNLQDYIPVTKEPVSFNLILKNPDDEILVFDKNIIVSGVTSPNTTIIISSEGEYLGLTSNSKGEFSKVVVLTAGINRIRVNAFDDRGGTKEILRSVYYSEEKLEE